VVAFRGVHDLKILVTAVEADGLNAVGEGKGRDVDTVQLGPGPDDGIANVEQEITDAGIGQREDLFEGNETFFQRAYLQSLPT
jgi:hypothetical protein